MSNLRNKIIRLAKENPELRENLLPLLGREASSTFDLDSYKNKLLKEAARFLKWNENQRKQWKDSYTSVLELYNITPDEEQKRRIESILSDLKSNLLTHLNSEKDNIMNDLRAISRLKFADSDITRGIAKEFKSERIRNSAMYYLDKPHRL